MHPLRLGLPFPGQWAAMGLSSLTAQVDPLLGSKSQQMRNRWEPGTLGAAFPSPVGNRRVGSALRSRIFSFKKRHK